MRSRATLFEKCNGKLLAGSYQLSYWCLVRNGGNDLTMNNHPIPSFPKFRTRKFSGSWVPHAVGAGGVNRELDLSHPVSCEPHSYGKWPVQVAVLYTC